MNEFAIAKSCVASGGIPQSQGLRCEDSALLAGESHNTKGCVASGDLIERDILKVGFIRKLWSVQVSAIVVGGFGGNQGRSIFKN